VLTTQTQPAHTSTIAGERVDTARPAADVVVDQTTLGQRIESFGGAFNEAGWHALAVLSDQERTAVLRRLFAPGEGLGLDHCRTPIGASDYALDRYTLSEKPGDYEMKDFSIARDRKLLIPYLKAALAIRPDLKLWASAWTPPPWMKDNRAYDSGAMKDEPRVYAAYALYLLKYIEAYRAEGIDVSMVVPQNEPGQLTRYPSADWTPAQYITFIHDHLGPLLAERSPETRIFVGTINRHDWDSLLVLQDAGVRKYVDGAAYQWRALENVGKIHATLPDLPLMQSETECGNNHWQPGFNPERPPNDFAYAAYTWRKFRDFISAGVSSYMLWNLVLDEQGKNIDSLRPWPQNAAVVVDRATKTVTYTPMYWVMHHYSALLARGARLSASTGPHADRLAFVQPDGTVVVQLLNDTDGERRLRVEVDGRVHTVALPPQSFGTLLVQGSAPAP
jgi:glucosylceramidase